MTATRWWVKAFARWIARVQAVQGQLNLFFTAMSGVSLASGALKYLGAPLWAIAAFLASQTLVLVVYVYLYSEGGVWNQVQRDKTDLSDNYSGPTMLMDARIEARQLAYLGYVLQNGQDLSIDEIETEMNDITHEEWAALRNGVDVTDIEGLQQRQRQ